MREGRRKKRVGFCLSVSLSVCFLAHVHLIEQAQPPHYTPQRWFHMQATLKRLFNISRGSRHLPDVGCVLHMCCKLSVAVVISQQGIMWVEHRKLWDTWDQSGAALSAGVTQTYWAHTACVTFTHLQHDKVFVCVCFLFIFFKSLTHRYSLLGHYITVWYTSSLPSIGDYWQAHSKTKGINVQL